MSRPSAEILSVARTLARGEEVPFETVMAVEEKEWCDGCWARMRKGIWADWFMGGSVFLSFCVSTCDNNGQPRGREIKRWGGATPDSLLIGAR